jgi:hypothetical protein
MHGVFIYYCSVEGHIYNFQMRWILLYMVTGLRAAMNLTDADVQYFISSPCGILVNRDCWGTVIITYILLPIVVYHT